MLEIQPTEIPEEGYASFDVDGPVKAHVVLTDTFYIPRKGDVNGDDKVTFTDLSAFSRAWGATRDSPYYLCVMDFDDSGEINYADLFDFVFAWTTS